MRETPDGGTVRVRDVSPESQVGSPGTMKVWPAVSMRKARKRGTGRFTNSPSSKMRWTPAARAARKLMAQMKPALFPDDLDFVVALDTTRAVTEGIKEIVITLVIALALVILVVYIFLQGFRATLIPLLAVPAIPRWCGHLRSFPIVRILD